MGEAGAAAQGEGLELGSDLGCSSIGGEVRGSGGNSLSSLRSLPSSALLPAVLPASQCNTPSKGDLRGGMENIHHLELNWDLSLVSVALLFPWDPTLWTLYSDLQKERPLCALPRVIVKIPGDD